MKLHTGDTVVIISGKDKNKTGTVLRVLPQENRVIVAGINIRTKHVKKNVEQAGKILRYEASIHASNVMAIDPKTKKRTRLGTKVDAKGKKVRIAKKSGDILVRVAAAKVAPKKEVTKEAKSKDSNAPATKSAPFWKRKAQAGAMEGDVKETPHAKKDQSIPDQQMHVRSGGRGV
jgi:large subunit ribosomal protein L24